MGRDGLLKLLVPHPRSLRLRALAVVVVATLGPLAVVAVSGRLNLFSGERLLRTVHDAAADSATVVAATDPGDWDEPLSDLARRHRMRVRVLDTDGAVMLDVDYTEPSAVDEAVQPRRSEELRQLDDLLGPLADRPEVTAARDSGGATGCRVTAGGEQLVCHGVVALSGDPALVVYVEDSAPRDIRTLYESRYSLIRVTLLVLPAALALAFWLGWRLVRPVDELRAQVRRQASQPTPGARLQLPRGDEFGELAEAFNGLLQRLEERSAANEAFVADLAHEFKNPVAAIRAAAESLQGGVDDPQRAQRLARVLRDSSGRLEVLLDQFLALARAEAGLADDERHDVDIGALVRGLAEAQAAQSPGLHVEARCAASAVVRGVPHALESALRNLLDNATAFAHERVVMAVRSEGRWVHIEVGDDGPGIDPADAERVFERFFTTRQGRKGTGLGLALVRAVAEAHGGTVAVDTSRGGGAVFVVRLPASA